MTSEELGKKRDELALAHGSRPDKYFGKDHLTSAYWPEASCSFQGGFDACADLLMPEIERLKEKSCLESISYDVVTEKNEQLRAQLAERDKEIERLRNNMRDVIDGKYKLDREFALEAQLSQARETITDFRSALEFYAKDFIDIDTEGNATRYKASAHNSDMAREVLARHPDSTEVKG